MTEEESSQWVFIFAGLISCKVTKEHTLRKVCAGESPAVLEGDGSAVRQHGAGAVGAVPARVSCRNRVIQLR